MVVRKQGVIRGGVHEAENEDRDLYQKRLKIRKDLEKKKKSTSMPSEPTKPAASSRPAVSEPEKKDADTTKA